MMSLRAWLLDAAPASRAQARAGRIYLTWLGFVASPAALAGLIIIGLLVFCAVLAPWLATHDPYAQNLKQMLQPPSAQHWLGTDELGRDIWSRVMYGARVTLGIVFMVAALAAPIGLLIGCTAGYLGGAVDRVLMRVTDIALAFPRLVLALAFVAALRPSLENAVIAIALTAWPPYARLARAETLVLRNSDYIAAVRLAGAGPLRIVLRQIVPLCLPSLIVRVTLDMAGVILIAAGIGFLGLGAQPPTAEWGAMLSNGRDFLLDAWWVATMPGIAIFITSLGFFYVMTTIGNRTAICAIPRKACSLNIGFGSKHNIRLILVIITKLTPADEAIARDLGKARICHRHGTSVGETPGKILRIGAAHQLIVNSVRPDVCNAHSGCICASCCAPAIACI